METSLLNFWLPVPKGTEVCPRGVYIHSGLRSKHRTFFRRRGHFL